MSDDALREVPRIILIGSASRAARAVGSRLNHAEIFGVARHGDADARIADYREVPAGLPFRNATVLNCVGSPVGSEQDMDKLNREVPLAWAREACAGGARQFIQLSSFSVYRVPHRIVADSAVGPSSPYGASKLAAEEGLRKLAASDCAITILRVPILVSQDPLARDDKLAALLSAVRRFRAVPHLSEPIRRSMLTYDGLGAAVSSLMDAARAGTYNAADPEPFSYELVAQCAAAIDRPVLRVPLPSAVARLLRLLRPALAARLFDSAELAPDANVLTGRENFVRLREAILRQLAQ